MSSIPQISFEVSRRHDVLLTAKNEAAASLLGSTYPVDFASDGFELDLLLNKARLAGGEFFDRDGRRYDAYDALREIKDEIAVDNDDCMGIRLFDDHDED